MSSASAAPGILWKNTFICMTHPPEILAGHAIDHGKPVLAVRDGRLEDKHGRKNAHKTRRKNVIFFAIRPHRRFECDITYSALSASHCISLHIWKYNRGRKSQTVRCNETQTALEHLTTTVSTSLVLTKKTMRKIVSNSSMIMMH